VDGEFASSTLLLLYRPLTAQPSCLSFSQVECFHGLWNDILIQSLHAFHAFCRYLTFLLLVLHTFVEPNTHLTLEIDSCVHGSFTGPNYTQTSTLYCTVGKGGGKIRLAVYTVNYEQSTMYILPT
jgi:hypothetical protein